MLPDIISLETPSSLQSLEAPVVHDLFHTSVPVAESSLYTNFTNLANRADFGNSVMKFYIDGICLEHKPSIPKDFLRVLVKAVHYA